MKRFGLFILLSLLFSSVLLPRVVLAQEGMTDEDRIDPAGFYSTPSEVSDTLNENTTGAQNVEKAAIKGLTGHGLALLQSAYPCLFKNCEEIEDEQARKGFGGVIEEQVVAMLDRQPTVNVVAHLAEEWVPGYKDTNSVYANGVDDLKEAKIVDLWSFTRNLAYAFYVVIMIVIGFMIMFRNKIGGQVMVTLGNSIPKIVISLVLVTFSFAIIGIIIDIGGILRNVISNLYYPNNSELAINVHNPFQLLGGFWGKNLIEPLAGFLPEGNLNLMGWIGHLLENLGKTILNLVLNILATGFVLFGAIKLWIMLVKTYFSLIINVVTAPLTIAMGSLPGNDSSLTNTFKSAARNVLVFPVAFAIVNLPYVLDNAGVSLKFPESLVGVDTTSGTFLPSLILGLAKVLAIFTAATAPEIVKSIIPPTASKSGIDTSRAMKDAMSKVPLLGGMFK
ncbi:MAG TPA: hypothetical protein PKL44_00995 [Candidatus Dojkabacteria bacterium]|nr:hypothetical protein [Candidatus Dojkabacteria bacterium]